ncbi:MAG: cysteine desulfurase [Candidatus Kaiserbacteria bacterium]|nr:cysteine desulfurase [Candidatus Kaiserbacteria bacterium]
MIRFFGQRRIYMDYASAPPVLPEALRAMREAEDLVGNPGAIHREGVEAKRALESARERIARILEVKPQSIVFTSGLTEANDLAIIGAARSIERTRRSLHGTHWIVSAIEHSSVLESFAEIERLGGTVTHLSPDTRGLIMAEAVARALKAETVFLSIGWGNNEIGTIQPLREISHVITAHEKAHKTRILFHSDAGQAPLYAPTLFNSLGIDLLSLGSNKLYGPHGIGALCISAHAEIAPILFGGPQERRLRPGTENAALAAGFAAAFERVAAERKTEEKRLREIRDDLAKHIRAVVPDAEINGDLTFAMPHMLNMSIPNISPEYLTLALDHEGIAVSTKSACREGEESRSHAVEALGGEEWRAAHTLRLSLGRDSRPADVERVVHALKKTLSRASGV